MNSYDVIIAGGGIGGCVAALALHRHVPDARVLLLDGGTYPRHKVCGEFFSPEGWAVLQRLGLTEVLLARGALPVRHARVLSAHGRTSPIPLPAPAWAISRWQLDELLWRQASTVSEARDKTHVRNIARGHAGYEVTTRGERFVGRFVLDAMGRNGRHLDQASPADEAGDAASDQGDGSGQRGAARFAGLKTHFPGTTVPAGEVQLYPFKGGYCGLVRVEEGRVNASLLARYGGLDKPELVWARAMRENPALRETIGDAVPVMNWLATGNVAFGKMEPVRGGVLCCGDAAGYIQPFAGDGQAMAARSGELAAACIGATLRGGLRERDTAAVYAAAWKREFSARLTVGAAVQPLLLAPWTGDLAARALALMPGIAREIARRTRDR